MWPSLVLGQSEPFSVGHSVCGPECTHASFAAIDSDHDGTLSLGEIKKAAAEQSRFRSTPIMTAADQVRTAASIECQAFAVADKDKDGTLSKDEYLALVERLFKAADVDRRDTQPCG
jgi:hypothetical protein